jgi:protein TonB
MQTSHTIRTHSIDVKGDPFGGGIAGSFVIHAAIIALALGWAYLHRSGQNWGDATAGAIQATMVNDLPLPPKPFADPNNVLATETPSPAPVAPKPKAEEAPKPDAIPIPVKNAKPLKPAEKPAPAPPPHPQPVKPDLTKAPSGEAPGIQLAMSSTTTRAGTFSIGETDADFGKRFGYYNEQIKRDLEANWITAMLDPKAYGHRVYITFTIGRDGTSSNIRIAQPSGDQSLDQSALSAVRHIDSFPPLPDAYTGSYINVLYYFDPPPRQ